MKSVSFYSLTNDIQSAQMESSILSLSSLSFCPFLQVFWNKSLELVMIFSIDCLIVLTVKYAGCQVCILKFFDELFRVNLLVV